MNQPLQSALPTGMGGPKTYLAQFVVGAALDEGHAKTLVLDLTVVNEIRLQLICFEESASMGEPAIRGGGIGPEDLEGRPPLMECDGEIVPLVGKGCVPERKDELSTSVVHGRDSVVQPKQCRAGRQPVGLARKRGVVAV